MTNEHEPQVGDAVQIIDTTPQFFSEPARLGDVGMVYAVEPRQIRIQFPWGTNYVLRTSDPPYPDWRHYIALASNAGWDN